MNAYDPQPAGRVYHVCPDVTVGQFVACATRATGLCYLRFENAFAAAARLLVDGPADCLLLIALDCLGAAEAALPAWASGRWPAMTVWVHGSPGRLNGHLATGRVKMVRLSDLAALLVEHLGRPPVDEPVARGPAVRGSDLREPTPELDPPADVGEPIHLTPDPQVLAPVIEQAPLDEPVRAGEDRARGEPALLASASATDPPAATPRAEPAAPPIRLAAPSTDPMLSEDELAALLGPEESAHA